MSLPPLLLERLKKRGIIKENQVSNKKFCETDNKKKVLNYKLVSGCPNKYNIYHECKKYCEVKYGNGMEQPSNAIKKIYEKLVEKYPLSDKWQEVWEPGIQRYYFWNIEDDEVSWYPFGHPKFKSSPSALKLKETTQSFDKKTDKDNFEKKSDFDNSLQNNVRSDNTDTSDNSDDSDNTDDLNSLDELEDNIDSIKDSIKNIKKD